MKSSLMLLMTMPVAMVPVVGLVNPQPAHAQQSQNAVPSDLELLPIRGHMYMLSGAGGNITISLGDDGVFLVDSGTAAMSDKVLAAVRQLAKTDKPVIRYIVNTSLDPDHTGGNMKIGPAGFTVTGSAAAETIADAGEGAGVIAHQNVLNRMSRIPKLPFAALPTDTYFGSDMKLSHFFNGVGVQIFHVPAAHTDGDSIVYFRGADDVISTGDIFLTTGYPVIDLEKGGGVQGVIDGLNLVIDLAIPYYRMEGGTMIIPGHGRLCDVADVAFYRDMVTIVRDRVQDLIKRGKTLEQVKAAKPTEDYDMRYGANSGSWTPDKFVEAVYKSLTSSTAASK